MRRSSYIIFNYNEDQGVLQKKNRHNRKKKKTIYQEFMMMKKKTLGIAITGITRDYQKKIPDTGDTKSLDKCA